MDLENLNHCVGICDACGGKVKMQFILGWGLVPNSAQCIDCTREASTNIYGHIKIKMRKRKKK